VRIWHGRHAEPLIAIWLIALVAAVILYRVEYVQPALSDLVRPVYVVVFALALLVTWKWFRARAVGARHDRRHGDRRHTDRRENDGADL
jgi:hypothetical protein